MCHSTIFYSNNVFGVEMCLLCGCTNTLGVDIYINFLKNDTSVGFCFCKINPFCIYNSLFIKQCKDTKFFFLFFLFFEHNLSLPSQSWLCIFSCLETSYETTMQDREKV